MRQDFVAACHGVLRRMLKVAPNPTGLDVDMLDYRTRAEIPYVDNIYSRSTRPRLTSGPTSLGFGKLLSSSRSRC